MSYFETKEDYYAFRAAWSRAVTSPKAKKQVSTYEGTSYETRKPCTIHTFQHGWLHESHMMLYNVLRDKPARSGFAPMKNPKKVHHGEYINRGVWNAANILNSRRQDAEIVLGIVIPDWPKPKRSKTLADRICGRQCHVERQAFAWERRRLDNFLAPFDGTVTYEMLAQIPKQSERLLERHYGAGKEIYQRMREGEENTFELMGFEQVAYTLGMN